VTGTLEVRRTRSAVPICAALAVWSLVPAFTAAQESEHAAGMRVYERWCAPCHDPGIEHPGTLALTAKYSGVKSGVLLEWTDLLPEITKGFVRTGISVMPFFRKTEISDEELEALAAYLARNTPGVRE
jgi:mono/diheme cytochrome c family protein